MSEMKHTPGPWVLDPKPMSHVIDCDYHAVEAGCGYHLAGVSKQGFCITGRMSLADARLIAAAPDLLHSLKEISDMFMARPDMVKALEPLRGFAENAVFDRAYKAIARAEGRSV